MNKHEAQHKESQHISENEMLLYLEQKLSPMATRQLEEHVTECAFCSDALDGWLMAQEKGELLVIPELGFDDNDKKNSKSRGFVYRYAAAIISVLSLTGIGYALLTNINFGNDKEIAQAITNDKPHNEVIVSSEHSLNDIDKPESLINDKPDAGLKDQVAKTENKYTLESSGVVKEQKVEKISKIDRKSNVAPPVAAAPNKVSNTSIEANSYSLESSKEKSLDNEVSASTQDESVQIEEVVSRKSARKSVETPKQNTKEYAPTSNNKNARKASEQIIKAYEEQLKSNTKLSEDDLLKVAKAYLVLDEKNQAIKLLQTLINSKNNSVRAEAQELYLKLTSK